MIAIGFLRYTLEGASRCAGLPDLKLGWYFIDCLYMVPSNVRGRILSQLNSSLATLADDIATDVGVARGPLNRNTVIDALCDQVLPDFGSACLVQACDLDAVLVTFLDFVLLYD